MKFRKLHWLLLIGGFVATQALMFWPKTLIPLLEPDLIENRVPAIWPKWPEKFEDLEKFRTGVDSYVTDNFPSRRYLIGVLNYLRYCAGYSGTPRVIVGKQGWLFYDDGSHLSQLRASTLDEASRSAWVSELAKREKDLNSRGMRYVVFSAPVKEHIYTDLITAAWLRGKPSDLTDADLLTSDVTRVGLTSLVNVSPRILNARAGGAEVYSPFDTHWTGEGAYAAYSALITHLTHSGVEIQLKSRDSFRESVVPTARQPQDLAHMLGISSFVQQKYAALEPVVKPVEQRVQFLGEGRDWTSDRIIDTDVNGPTLLFTGDSFSTALLPLLATNFSRIIFTHHQNGFHRSDLIEKFKPDIVLLEVIESGFRHAMQPSKSIESLSMKKK